MVTVFYFHTGRGVEYHKDFDDVHEARKYYIKLEHVGYYIVSYICNTSYEMNVMEGLYK